MLRKRLIVSSDLSTPRLIKAPTVLDISLLTAHESGAIAVEGHNCVRVLYPKNLITERDLIFRGQKDPVKIREFAVKYASWLRSLKLLRDEQAEFKFVNYAVKQILGSSNDLRTNLFITKYQKLKDGGKLVVWMPWKDVKNKFDAMWDVERKVSSTSLDSAIFDTLAEVDASAFERMGPRADYLGYPKDGFDKACAMFSDKDKLPPVDLSIVYLLLRDILPHELQNSLKWKPVSEVLRTSGPSDGASNEAGADPDTASGLPWMQTPWRPMEGKSASVNARAAWVFDEICKLSEGLRSKMSQFGVVAKPLSIMYNRFNVSRGLPDRKKRSGRYDPKKKRVVYGLYKPDIGVAKQLTDHVLSGLKRVRYNNEFFGLTQSAKYDLPVTDMEMLRALNYCHDKGMTMLCADYSAYDQTIHPVLMEIIGAAQKGILSDGGDFAQNYQYGVGHIRLITPTEVMYGTHGGGNPSGGSSTNADGSLLNESVFRTGHYKGLITLELGTYNGDDSAAAGEGLTPEVFEEMSREYGFVGNAEKQFYKSGFAHFDQRLYARGFLGGIYPIARAVTGCVSLERLKLQGAQWNPELQTMQISSRIMNAAFHYAFEATVKWLADNDAYQLGRDKPAGQVAKEAGRFARDVLLDKTTINYGVESGDVSKWSKNAFNRVLRGGSLPPVGSVDRFIEVYGKERVALAEQIVGLSPRALLQGEWKLPHKFVHSGQWYLQDLRRQK